MLSAIRKFAKSPFAVLLFGLLVVSFGVWGIRDVFTTSNFSDDVVKAAGRTGVTSAQFTQIFNDEKTRREQDSHQQIPLEMALKFNLDRNIADGLAAAEASGALMQQEGINPGDQLIADEIRKVPAFFNPVTGQFDKQTYLTLLGQRHITEAQADAEFRDGIAQRQYIAGLAAGLKAPRIYGLVQAAFQKEGRDFDYFVVDPKAVGEIPKPTDAQLNEFIKQNADKLTKPEMRALSLVHFSAVTLAQTIPVSDAEVQKRFAFEKDALSTPEKRTVYQVTVKDQKTGEDVAAKLRAGGDPAAVAKADGAQINSYQATPKSAIADPAIASAAFGLKLDEVAGPIQGSLGLAVIKVTAIAPAKEATLEESRAKIEGEVKQATAKQKVYDFVQKYEDSHSSGADMAASAKAAGQQVQAMPAAITAQGGTLEGQRANLPPKVLQTAFTLPAGAESDTLDLGQGEYWIVHVDKVIAPALFGLDETVQGHSIRELVNQGYMQRALFDKLTAKGDALIGEIKKGKTLDAAAAEVGAKVEHAADVLRTAGQATTPGQAPTYTNDLLGQVFEAKVGDVVKGGAPPPRPGLVIAKLIKVQEAAPPILAGLAEAGREQATRGLFEDIGGSLKLAAQRKIKPKVDYKLARKAAGGDSDSASGQSAPASPAH